MKWATSRRLHADSSFTPNRQLKRRRLWFRGRWSWREREAQCLHSLGSTQATATVTRTGNIASCPTYALLFQPRPDKDEDDKDICPLTVTDFQFTAKWNMPPTITYKHFGPKSPQGSFNKSVILLANVEIEGEFLLMQNDPIAPKKAVFL